MRSGKSVRRIVLCAWVAVFWAIEALRPAWPGVPKAGGILLFTPQEARELRLNDQDWQHLAKAREISAGPQIVVHQPEVMPGAIPTIETLSPTDLYVTFEPRHAPVRMDSLRVEARKGFFSKSLTELVGPYIHSNSVDMHQVEIPTGRFLLEISIADTNGNLTDATYRLEVDPKRSLRELWEIGSLIPLAVAKIDHLNAAVLMTAFFGDVAGYEVSLTKAFRHHTCSFDPFVTI